MWAIRGFSLIALLAIAFAETSAAQNSSTNPKLVRIESGIVRSVAGGDVINFKGAPNGIRLG
ncbi:MAG: hypothetical protein ACHP6J_00700 [Burkholderiales bacterium]